MTTVQTAGPELGMFMEAPPLERKLVAILAADVQGYSRLMEADEEGTLATLSAFRAIIDTLIAKHGGRICGTAGDSVLAAFASALAASQCAVEIQQRLFHANRDIAEERKMRFRIGVNVGDVMVKDGDIFGDGVNIATRLEGLAEPGGICISRGVHDHVLRKLSYNFEDLGEKSVKNIAQPVRVYRVIFDTEAPVPELEPVNTLSGVQQEPIEIDSLPTLPPSPPAASAAELMFWETIKDSARISDFEAYLTEYPEGSFVSLAASRVDELKTDPPRSAKDREVELLFWESVRESDKPSPFQAYIEKYPEGEFKTLAEIRLLELAERSTG